MKPVLTIRNISIAMVTLMALVTFVFIVLNVRLSKRVFDAPSPNPYLHFVIYDELPYQPEETRSLAVTEGKKFFDEGMKSYVRKDYAGAIRSLKQAVRTESQDEWWLYLGVSYFMNHETASAINALEKADTLSPLKLKTPARWYLAQAYLVDRKIDRAKPLLESIVASKNERSALADSLLAQIRAVAVRKR